MRCGIHSARAAAADFIRDTDQCMLGSSKQKVSKQLNVLVAVERFMPAKADPIEQRIGKQIVFQPENQIGVWWCSDITIEIARAFVECTGAIFHVFFPLLSL